MTRTQELPARAPRDDAVRLEHIVHVYRETRAVDDVSLAVERGEFLTLLGPSGSGKTTLLRIIAGLVVQTAGRVAIGGRDVTALPPQRRGVGMVFQNYALFPHMSVRDNVAYPLRVRRIGRAETERRVDQALERVALRPMKRRLPSALSGGQQQRVALARALIYEPAVLLLDEPLGALDRLLRRQMQVEVRALQRQLGATCILVTHDQEEALAMSDRVGVMNDGRLLQLDTPANLYHAPSDAFVAHFVGDTNLFDVETTGRRLVRAGGIDGPILSTTDEAVAGTRLVLGVRPEFVRLSPSADVEGTNEMNSIPAIVFDQRFLGSVTEYSLRTRWGQTILARIPRTVGINPTLGTEVHVSWQIDEQTVHSLESSAAAGTTPPRPATTL